MNDELRDAAEGGGTQARILRGLAAEEGQAVAEYAVILALVASVLIFSYQLLGEKTLAIFNKVVTAF
jgi:Flp pilus assembly pilin Flp